MSRNSQLSNQIGKEGIGKLKKLKLIFINQTTPTIFTNNEIEAKNGKPLLVAICDTTNSNAIIKTGSLSSALVELVVLNGDFGSDLRRQQISWSWSDFNKNIVSKRVGKRPLIVGNDMIVCLKDGVGFIKGLSFSDNSSWTKSKKFRLGAKVVDQEILAKFPRIQEAVSQPFRVMDHRGEDPKQQNLKDMELEVVHHQFGAQLQHLLSNPQTFQEHLGENYVAMGGQGFEGIGEQDNHFIFDDDYPPLLPQEEASSTSYNHNHKGRPWTGLVPKPK
ncbi:unnamed protein product [Citrullus colocynthis]|uniref:Calmodulin binding protein-like N-terminal domain-containing protein n=1 Tax=Citrullus colocynthis TaxID=252529 RepID=A0ABP0ZAV8_9ROSI